MYQILCELIPTRTLGESTESPISLDTYILWEIVFVICGRPKTARGCTLAAVSAQQPVEHVKNLSPKIGIQGDGGLCISSSKFEWLRLTKPNLSSADGPVSPEEPTDDDTGDL